MKKTSVLILSFCLVAFSLACLSTAAVDPDQSVDQSLPVSVSVSPVPSLVPSAVPVLDRCVVVLAESLHLRRGPALDAHVLTWLSSGVVLVLIDDSDPAWYLVQLGELRGYVRSVYVQGVECGS